MKYTLETAKGPRQQRSLREYGSKFLPLFATERAPFAGAVAAILISSGATLVAPVIIVRTIDTDIRLKNMHGLLISALFVFLIYAAGAVASYVQVRTMGGVGRRVLYYLRNELFLKLQDLPVAFFNQNKAGDLISRLNNDTDKLNQFVSQALMQFVGSVFLISGARHISDQPQHQAGPGRAHAGFRRPASDSGDLRMGEAHEPRKPAGAGRNELGNSGEPE